MDSVRLIASDMDGTLLNRRGELEPDFFTIFEQLEKHGIRFAAASGRQYDGLRKTFSPVADRMLFIAENGAYVADGRDEWLVADMERETAAPLIVQIRDIEGACIVLGGPRFRLYRGFPTRVCPGGPQVLHPLRTGG